MNTLQFKIVPLLAAASSSSLLVATAWLLGLLFVVGVLWWLVDYAKAPAPLNTIIKVVLVVVALVILIKYVIYVAGKPPF